MTKRIARAVVALGLILGAAGPACAGVVTLDFQDLAIPGETFLTFFTPYESQGFRLTATNTPSGSSSGFQARGSGAGLFYAGARGMATFSPAAPPDNVIELAQISGQPFSLLSIDLARNFIFDPAPTVTFTGDLASGGTVMQTFTVTTAPGVAAFQTFNFTGFTDVVAVRWGQPVLADGLHQFTNVTLDVAVVPEPSTLALLGAGVACAAFGTRRLGRSRVRPLS